MLRYKFGSVYFKHENKWKYRSFPNVKNTFVHFLYVKMYRQQTIIKNEIKRMVVSQSNLFFSNNRKQGSMICCNAMRNENSL